jgi:hypothetical protein
MIEMFTHAVSVKNNQNCFIELVLALHINTHLIKINGLIRQTQIDHLVPVPYCFFEEYNISMYVPFRKITCYFLHPKLGRSLCAREFFTWRT